MGITGGSTNKHETKGMQFKKNDRKLTSNNLLVRSIPSVVADRIQPLCNKSALAFAYRPIAASTPKLSASLQNARASVLSPIWETAQAQGTDTLRALLAPRGGMGLGCKTCDFVVIGAPMSNKHWIYCS